MIKIVLISIITTIITFYITSKLTKDEEFSNFKHRITEVSGKNSFIIYHSPNSEIGPMKYKISNFDDNGII